jgi:hypothetical protein
MMLLAGRLVAIETGNKSLGNASMAALGVTTVMEIPTTWYSAGQTLWAGLAMLVCLLCLQSWRDKGGRFRLLAACLAAMAAPFCWSGGYAAVPVGFAYLVPRGWPVVRRAGLPLLFAFLASITIGFAFSSRSSVPAADEQPRKVSVFSRLANGALSTAQAIPEVLVLNNLGLDAATSPGQGIVLCLIVFLIWSRFGANITSAPLESAGASLIALGFGMAFFFRGDFTYDNLRAIAWYNTIPQTGFVLFLGGWIARGSCRWIVIDRSALREKQRRVFATIAIISLVAIMLTLHAPRAARIRVEGRGLGPEPSDFTLRDAKTRALMMAHQQRDALARLDRVESTALRLGIGREAIRRAFGRVEVPGWPEQVKEWDAIDLLRLPQKGLENDLGRVRAAIEPFLGPSRGS